MSKKILITGMNPSHKSKSRTIRRLDEWTSYMGIEKYSFVNAVSKPGRVHKNMVDKTTLIEYSKVHDKVIALGNFASGALDLVSVSHFKLPHPSGLNRMINDPERIRERLEACKSYLAR